jgi:hypothetical protein
MQYEQRGKCAEYIFAAPSFDACVIRFISSRASRTDRSRLDKLPYDAPLLLLDPNLA